MRLIFLLALLPLAFGDDSPLVNADDLDPYENVNEEEFEALFDLDPADDPEEEARRTKRRSRRRTSFTARARTPGSTPSTTLPIFLKMSSKLRRQGRLIRPALGGVFFIQQVKEVAKLLFFNDLLFHDILLKVRTG